jgi:hypothetical protein
MDKTLLPLERSLVVIQPPTPGWTVGGRIISVIRQERELAYVFIRADKDHDPLLVVDRQGRIVRGWGKGLVTVPHNVKVDEEGNIWTADAGPGTVLKFSPEGTVLLRVELGDTPTPASGGCAFLANPGNGNLDFCGATDVTTTLDGRIFVIDGYGKKRVLEYSARGDTRVRAWGGPGTTPGTFGLPHGLATDGQVLCVADRDGQSHRAFDLSGRLLGEWSRGTAGSLAMRTARSDHNAVRRPVPASAGRRRQWRSVGDQSTGDGTILGNHPRAGAPIRST